MANKLVRFKIIGVNKGKTIRLGPRKQYAFVDGICEFECPPDEIKLHAHPLKKYYSAVQVKIKKQSEDDTKVDIDEVETGSKGKDKKGDK